MMLFRYHCFSLLLVAASAQSCPSLIWNDEFDGDSLDISKWSFQNGDGCDLGICGWGNNELQFYRPENVEVSGGTLKITAKNELYEGKQYTSSRIRSLGKGDLDLTKPTRIEARLKTPSGWGMWPAFWMLPSQMELTSWPLGGEIDIMEFIGREPNFGQGYLHYGLAWNDKGQLGGPLKMPTSPSDLFHVYTLEKKQNEISFLIDGYKYQTYSPADIEDKFTWPFESTYYLILNLAVGGNWPDFPDETTVFPTSLEVDYVRVYDLSPETAVGHITGSTLVRINTAGEQYCITDIGTSISYSEITWYVPAGATFSDVSEFCIEVNFGTSSGFVAAEAVTSCGGIQGFSVPVEVQGFHGKELALLLPDTATDSITYNSSTGQYTTETSAETGETYVVYDRMLEDMYDHIRFDTSVITDPEAYVSGDKKFFIDMKRTTSAKCTRVFLQLEGSAATLDNFPTARHSRYIAYLDDTDDWQRLGFDFYDRPDRISGPIEITKMFMLIDSYVQRSDTYYFRNLDSASIGCTDNCEEISTNQCRTRAKSESGACDDGINNNGLGFDQDGYTDCDDADCWNDPVCADVRSSPLPPLEPQELCDDGIDNDGNGLIDCDDMECADAEVCGSWYLPACSAHSECAGLIGDCCPTPLGTFRDCCDVAPSSCSVNLQCANFGYTTGECCPNEDGLFLDCCEPDSCNHHPRCSGLDGECCPTIDGTFLDCCLDSPAMCKKHPQCGQSDDECCPTPDGTFLACCEPRECSAHPECDGKSGDCCPNAAGVYDSCCSLDMPSFAGSSIEWLAVSSNVHEPTSSSIMNFSRRTSLIILAVGAFLLILH